MTSIILFKSLVDLKVISKYYLVVLHSHLCACSLSEVPALTYTWFHNDSRETESHTHLKCTITHQHCIGYLTG